MARILFLILAILTAWPAWAAKPPPIARITVDLDTMEVLEAAEIDALRKPASLTKMMTGYLAFRALKAGQITEDKQIEISSHVASRPPFGVGLTTGQKVSFGDLLRAAIIASANDAAAAVGEALAGTEVAFTERMNLEAIRLGMKNTVFKTASGLPASGQKTSARDMAILAAALLRDFPERSRAFGRTAAPALGRTVSTTNGLLSSYEGAKGVKTGYTCRAGYSIAGLAERNGRRILAVTLGHSSSGARNQAVKAQLDRGFAATDKAGEKLAPAAAATTGDIASVGACSGSSAVSSRPSGWSVFLGAYRTAGAARKALSRARKMTKGAKGVSYVGKRRLNSTYAAVAHSFSRANAQRFCAAGRRAGIYCVVLPPKRTRSKSAPWR